MKYKNFCHITLTLLLGVALVFAITSCGDGAGGHGDPYVDGSGSGTAGNPFIVGSVASLQKVGSGIGGWTLSACYRQTKDIDLSSVPNWKPIGTLKITEGLPDYSEAFTGKYYTSDFSISNLTINRPADDLQGLFGVIYGPDAAVEYIKLINVNISGKGGVGGVAGNNGGQVRFCSVSGSVRGAGGVGGIVGNSGGLVEYCTSSANVIGADINVGGIAGSNYDGDVRDCYFTGNVQGHAIVGGVVGRNDSGKVMNCYATGTVASDTYNSSTANGVGGIVGFNEDYDSVCGRVQFCVALNTEIIAGAGTPVTFIGRVVGAYTAVTEPYLNGNYARNSGMTIKYGGTTYIPVETVNPSGNKDGADASPAQYQDQTWWENLYFNITGGFYWHWDPDKKLPVFM